MKQLEICPCCKRVSKSHDFMIYRLEALLERAVNKAYGGILVKIEERDALAYAIERLKELE